MNWKVKSLDIAEIIDALRVVPRTMLIIFGVLVWHVTEWYMALPEPTTQHAALVATVVTVIPAVIGLYQTSGRKWKDKIDK